AAANANLAIWRDEPVLDRVADLTRRQADRLAKLQTLPGVVNARQLGTVAAIEIGEDTGNGYLSDLAPRLLMFFRERDVLLRPLGNTVYVMPPYCICDVDLDLIFDVIGEATQKMR